MQRITDKHLDHMLDLVNKALGIVEPDIREPGSIMFDKAYGGVKVVQIANESGGQSNLSQHGHGTKREAHIFLAGMLAYARIVG